MLVSTLSGKLLDGDTVWAGSFELFENKGNYPPPPPSREFSLAMRICTGCDSLATEAYDLADSTALSKSSRSSIAGVALFFIGSRKNVEVVLNHNLKRKRCKAM